MLLMESECVIFEDSSEFSSDDGFGWKVSALNSEKNYELFNNAKMALSNLSDVNSSESADDDEDLRFGDVLNKVKHDKYVSRQEAFLRDENGKNKSVLPKKRCNSVSDSDGEEFPAQELVDLGSMKNERERCVIASSSGHPLKPEELVGVDSGLYEADDSEPALYLEDLSSDEEVWLMQCPITVNPEKLKTHKLLSSSTSRISVGEGQVLEVSSHTQGPKTVTLVLPSRDHTCRLVVLKCAGQIRIREHIDMPQPAPIDAKKRHVPFPVGLKMRHPLLGPDYENELEHYNDSLKRHSSYRKQMKRKKRKRESDELEVGNSLEGNGKVSKHKKIKLLDYKTCEKTSVFDDLPENQVSHKRKKKKSQNIEDSFVNEGTAQSNVSYSKKKKKHKRNSEVEAFSSMSEKEGKEFIFQASTNMEKEEDEPQNKKKNKKKKKRDSVVDSVKSEPVDDLFIKEENIISSSLLSERSKGGLMATDREIDNSVTESSASSVHTEKKKKKKKKRSSNDKVTV